MFVFPNKRVFVLWMPASCLHLSSQQHCILTEQYRSVAYGHRAPRLCDQWVLCKTAGQKAAPLDAYARPSFACADGKMVARWSAKVPFSASPGLNLLSSYEWPAFWWVISGLLCPDGVLQKKIRLFWTRCLWSAAWQVQVDQPGTLRLCFEIIIKENQIQFATVYGFSNCGSELVVLDRPLGGKFGPYLKQIFAA